MTNLDEEIEECRSEMLKSGAKIARMAIKGRYLQHLGSKKVDVEELREDCIICMGSSNDERGVILECGHFYCQVSGPLDCADDRPVTRSSDRQG